MLRFRPSMARTSRLLYLLSARSFATTIPTRAGGLHLHLQKNPNDVVITLALRTPLCRANKGRLKDTSSDELLLGLLKGVKEKSNFDTNLVEDIAIGELDLIHLVIGLFY